MTRALEDENISLEESFTVYQKGMELLKYCNESIDKVEKKVLVLNGEGKLDEFLKKRLRRKQFMQKTF